MKVNIATVAPEFNVTMAKTKVSKKGQRTLYSQYFFFFFFKRTQGKNVPLKSNSIFSFSEKYNKINSIK